MHLPSAFGLIDGLITIRSLSDSLICNSLHWRLFQPLLRVMFGESQTIYLLTFSPKGAYNRSFKLDTGNFRQPLLLRDMTSGVTIASLDPLANPLWNYFINPSLACFSWHLLRRKTPTDILAKSKGIKLASRCPIRLSSKESDLHLFFSCSLVYAIWSWLLSATAGTIWSVLSLGREGFGRSAVTIFFHAISFLWLLRNDSKYNGKKASFSRAKTILVECLKEISKHPPSLSSKQFLPPGPYFSGSNLPLIFFLASLVPPKVVTAVRCQSMASFKFISSFGSSISVGLQEFSFFLC